MGKANIRLAYEGIQLKDILNQIFSYL